MQTHIIFGVGVLIVGAVLSRAIQTLQFRRIGIEKRNEVLQRTRRLRTIALIPALVMVILFIIGVIVMPDSFLRLIRLMILAGAAYIIVINIFVLIGYARAKCSLLFIIIAFFAKGIVFASLILFCYFIITAIPQS